MNSVRASTRKEICPLIRPVGGWLDECWVKEWEGWWTSGWVAGWASLGNWWENG